MNKNNFLYRYSLLFFYFTETVDMVYTNWESHADYIKSLQWYSFKDTIAYLNKLTRFIIDTPSKMSDIRCPQLQDTMCTPPADKTNRCSETDIYLCEAIGNWKIEMDLLQLGVCSFLYPKRCHRDYPLFQTQGEAEVYALKQIDMVAENARKYRIQQSEFESFFNLKWRENGDTSTGEETTA